jgi:hypothetical protein
LDWKTLSIFLAFVFTGAIILAVFVAFYSPPDPSSRFQPTPVQLGPGGGECTPGEEAPCEGEDGCAGVSTCLHGSWSPCHVPKECEPGEKRFCNSGGCTNGIQVCGSCGSWGACLPQ